VVYLGPEMTSSTGQYVITDCQISCDQGMVQDLPVEVVLDKAELVCGHLFFTRVLLTVSNPPASWSGSRTVTFTAASEGGVMC
jgi:hypothetical protein